MFPHAKRHFPALEVLLRCSSALLGRYRPGGHTHRAMGRFHEAILCFMPSLSTKLCTIILLIELIGSVNVPTLPCSHGNVDIQQSQIDCQDSWRQCASSADCFVTILCPSEHVNHLDVEWMDGMCMCVQYAGLKRHCAYSIVLYTLCHYASG